jgi:hypothetical protein
MTNYTARTILNKLFLNFILGNSEVIPKLSGACYGVRSVVHISNINTLKSIYNAYFHSIIKYGIIFWGNSSNNRKIFTLQKKIVTIMAVAQPRTPRRCLFKQLEILPVPCQYIFSLMKFIVSNQENFQTNLSTDNINTRNTHHLHRPNTNLFFSSEKYISCWNQNFQ